VTEGLTDRSSNYTAHVWYKLVIMFLSWKNSSIICDG